jgi:hypothetical protein
MQKLYCYVDESGQDTQGLLFLVCCTIILTAEKEQRLEKELAVIERAIRKKYKWIRTREHIKINYLERLLRLHSLKGSIFIKRFSNTIKYLDKTIEAITRSIREIKDRKSYEAKIFIDALSASQARVVAVGLRRRDIRVEKVRGLKDSQKALLRLSDAMSGLTRDYIRNKDYALKYYSILVKRGFITEIKKPL